ncbi:MAG: sigma-54-dependent transcriptional regulator [Chloroflexota bacterium]
MKARGKIFLVDDDELIVAVLSRALKSDGYDVSTATSTLDVVKKIKASSPDIVMLDINLPGRSGVDILEELKKTVSSEVIMLTADDTADTAVRAMKLGAADYLTKPFNIDEVKIVIANILEKEKLKQEVGYLRKLHCDFFKKDIIGESQPMRDLAAKVAKMVEASVSTILITGESGTGKELLARHIHSLLTQHCSPGEYVPFVGINCTTLPESILESELFGYERGAFTDAKSDKKGLFELAQGGTLLLDEIGEMKPSLQAKLLRVLEERAIRRIGGQREIPIDVTVMATTNRDLAESVEKSDFRMDLFYRLNAFALHIPPLRERKEDIPLLVSHFLSVFAQRYGRQTIKGLSPDAERLMLLYSWPGNVRELKNVVERIVVLESADTVLPEHLPKEMLGKLPSVAPPPNDKYVLPDSGISLEDFEKDLIMQALEKTRNNKTAAARLLNISYDTLRYQIKKYGLE